MSARVAARLAARSVRAAPGRSALITALIALPVAGAVMGGLVQASGIPTTAEQITTELGKAQARLQVVSAPDRTIVQDPVSLQWTSSGEPAASSARRDPASALPAGTRILPIYAANVTARTAAGVAALPAVVGRAWDPAFAGRWDLAAGVRPTGADQIVVTRAALDRLGVAVGGSIELLDPARRTLVVSGVLDDRTAASSTAELFGTAAALGTTSPGLQSTSYYLPDHSLSWAEVRRLNTLGITTFSRAVVQDPPPTPAPIAEDRGVDVSLLLQAGLVAVAVAFVLFEIVLLAGAAFAVTARQQQRSLAVIASVGSDRQTLGRIVTGSGIAIGLAGGFAGVVLGLLAGTVALLTTSDGSATRYYGWHIPWLVIGVAVLVAVLAGWLSALLPARSAARADVLAALRGARAPAPARRRTPILGITLVVAGAALTLWGGALIGSGVFRRDDSGSSGLAVGLLAGGPMLMQLGALLSIRLVLAAIARVASPLGVGARLATRDLVRNRGRSVPAVAAVMATVFVGILLMCLVGASNEQTARDHTWSARLGQVSAGLRYSSNPDGDGDVDRVIDPDAAVATARSTLGSGDVRVLHGVPDGDALFSKTQLRSRTLHATLALSCGACTTTSGWTNTTTGAGAHLYVGSAADIAAVTGRPLSSAARRTLDDGGAIAVNRDFTADGHVTIGWWTAKQLSNGDAFPAFMADSSRPQPTRTDVLPAVTAYPEHPLPYGAFISTTTAERLGLPVLPISVLATPTNSPSPAQVDAFNAQMGALENSPTGVDYSFEQGPSDLTAAIGWFAAIACAVIVIAASAAAVGLSRIDNRPDADTLAAIGAPPAVQRRTAFWLALVVAGIGSLVGAGLALVPAVALGLPGAPLPFAPPWAPILALALGVPILIAAASWAARPQQRQLARRAVIA